MAPVAALSKSREANELNARALAIVDKWADPNDKDMSDPEKFAASRKEVETLKQRAQALAGFTIEAELERQGGTDVAGLKKLDGNGVDADAETDKSVGNGWKQAAQGLRKEITRAFGQGGMETYLKAAVKPGAMDKLTQTQREVMNKAQMLTRTIIGQAGDPSGGEFLLPLEQEPSIFMIEVQEQGLLQRARRYSVSGRTLRIPYVRQTDPANARPIAGIANVTIIGEAQTKTDLEPAFSQRLLTIYKYAAIAQIGDETIRDDFTGDLQPVVSALVGGQCLNAMNEHFSFSGTGLAMPLGALNASNPALLTFSRTGGANPGVGSGTFVPADAFTLFSYHTHGPNSFWYVSRRTVQGIFSLALTSGTTGVAWVSYLPDLRGKPGMMLLGLPVVVSDILPSYGLSGDINLVNPDFYAVGLRQQLTVESSIHVAFEQDVTTYRYLCRGGGIPVPDGTYAYQASGGSEIDPHSPFVQLL